MDKKHNYCMLLAGGKGVRLWPYSRAEKPKQFIDFFGTGQSLLQMTYQRVRPLFDNEHIFVLTHQDYAHHVKEQLPEIADENILLESQFRNTAPAITWAATYLYTIDPDANMAVLPTDQVILNEPGFRSCLEQGLDFVNDGTKLLTLVVKPTRPDTTYGYIQVSDEKEDGMLRVQSFTEKPQPDFAKLFMDCGEFYWNVGIFLWSVNGLLNTVMKHIPEIAEKVEIGRTSEDIYAACPNLSIDYGILERSKDVFAMVCTFGWMDVGSWEQYYQMSPKDSNENVIGTNQVLAYNSQRNLIQLPNEKLVVVEDLNDFIVMEQRDVLLICPRSKAANIRKYVNDVQVYWGDEFV
ncbi:MAG: mannose-1-phosphate guanylyltransferase [Bacteroidaceae bacterium]|nr:mannose-1-phosphate guanylyltransferase [Bacteroidaceae bacterium]